MSRPNRILVAAPLIIAALLVAGCASAPVPEPTPGAVESPGHRRMVETLAALAVQSETDNPYLGRGQIDRARAELAAMAEEEVAKRWFLNMYLGKNELRLGQATRIQRLEIYWPTSDLTQSFEDLAVDRWLEIEEGGALRVRDGHPH